MNAWEQAIITGMTSFVATNLDDIVVLMMLFSTVDGSLRPRHIIAGQYLGFTILIAASLPGFLGGFVIAKPWLGLLGILPIAIGISHLWQQGQPASIQDISDELKADPSHHPMLMLLAQICSPQIYKVAAITIANGGDNIGIYVPLFASSNLAQLSIMLIVFFSLIGVWCWLAYQFTQHPTIGQICTRYGHRMVPFVLIALGLFILLDSHSYELLPWFSARTVS